MPSYEKKLTVPQLPRSPLSIYTLQFPVQIYRAVEKRRRGRGSNPLPSNHLPAALTHQATARSAPNSTINIRYRSGGEVQWFVRHASWAFLN